MHRAYRPRLTTPDITLTSEAADDTWPMHYPGYARYYWTQNDLNRELADPAEGALWQPDWRTKPNPNNQNSSVVYPGFEAFNRTFVAFTSEVPEPFIGAAMPNGVATANDARVVPRIVKFPSGERPRLVTGVAVGTAAQGGTTLGVPSAVVDEIVWGLPSLGSDQPWTQGGSLQLAQDLEETGETLAVVPQFLRTASGSPTVLNRVDVEDYPRRAVEPRAARAQHRFRPGRGADP